MALKDQLNHDLHDAMRSRDETRKTALRLALASVKNAEIEARAPLDDEGVLRVLSREAKQRRESIEEFRKGHRDDLVAKEQSELDVILAYLPAQLSRDEIEAVVRRIMAEVGASSPADKGKVMPKVMAELRDKADGREVNAVVTDILAAS